MFCLMSMQRFVKEVLVRLQSVNLEKEGAQVKLGSNIKNELRMITLPNQTCKLWEEVFARHLEGTPMTKNPYHDAKNFKPSSNTIKENTSGIWVISLTRILESLLFTCSEEPLSVPWIIQRCQCSRLKCCALIIWH